METNYFSSGAAGQGWEYPMKMLLAAVGGRAGDGERMRNST
jgi:hypothetical protein